MIPIRTKEANFTYLGPHSEIADLPCRREAEVTFSIWEPTEKERSLIASGGRVRLGIYGARPIPPVSLQIVGPAGDYERVPAPCRLCGKEADDPVHESGDGTHAFKLPLTPKL
jgi:hypothetical protein